MNSHLIATGILGIAICLSGNKDTIVNTIPNQEQEQDFKLQLLQEAIKFGIPHRGSFGPPPGNQKRGIEDDEVLEVAVAIGFDEIHQSWLKNADENERLFILSSVATHAATYGRSDLASTVAKQIPDSPEKLEVNCRLAFLFGYEANQPQFQSLLDRLERTAAPAFEEYTLEQWRETFCFAFNCGNAASGRAIENMSGMSTQLFRDTVRAYRAHQLLREGKLELALAAVRSMESTELQSNLLCVLIEDASRRESEISIDTSAIGRELFLKYHQISGNKDYAESEVFRLFENSRFGQIEPIDGIPWVASLLIENVFDLNAYDQTPSAILAPCIKSGFRGDKRSELKLIEDVDQRKAWLRALLNRLEQDEEFQVAWETSQNFKETLGGGTIGDENYLGKLVRLACRRDQFELAESFLDRIHNETRKRDARFTLAAHRQSQVDINFIQITYPEIFTEFRRELAAVGHEQQLMWMYKLVLRLPEERLLVLREEIKTEFARRKDSKSRNDVAKLVRNAARSMTPLGESIESLMEELTVILGIDLEPRVPPERGIDKVLKRLKKQKPGDALSSKDKQFLFDVCVNSRRKMGARGDKAVAQVAVAYSALGEKEEVIKVVDLIEDRVERFYALLNCAMAYPPTSAPLVRGNIYSQRIRQGGFLPGGVF